ncbi:amidophosphoribosyltransferase [bacterium]|nr:amidophosphoribosyltransferase [bacterium]
MGGFFGIASKNDCVSDLFYGTDYHSHLGTMRGGLAVQSAKGITRFIHDITNAQFRGKFENDITKLSGNLGIGVISDMEDQPLVISSHLGTYAIVTVGKINNMSELAAKAFTKRTTHFSEMGGGGINPTELVATLINQEATFEIGIKQAQDAIEGSCSILLMTETGIFAARDKLGRTPIIIGKKDDSFAATMETCAFPNLGFTTDYYLGPGEIMFLSPDGIEQRNPPEKEMQICSFLWVYYGYPSSSYESINVEASRYRCGACLSQDDDVEVDLVAGIPDSGTAHAIGYANDARVPYARPFVKYTPTWPRSFMPQNQQIRDLVASMKLIPIKDLISDKRLLFCEDSIVRGTQLQDTVQRLYDFGAKEVHMRPACPPLVYGCKFLNFSRSKSVLDLAARRAIRELEGEDATDISAYADSSSEKYNAMIEIICKRLHLTSLKYQKLDNLVKAIGLPKEKLCTYCWDKCE